MQRINVLSETIYSRIAAGEVVVNPAAVIKELMENAMDADSTAITVEIEQGGKELMRVTDNGYGIHKDDMPLTVQKHATSKVRAMEDLEQIKTLGFRGEALASISAAAKLTIRSRTRQSIEGMELQVMGDGKPELLPAGLPEGTTVLVEKLFYNIPARKKFLKSTGAETTAITSVVTKLMLANPEISIKFINNGKVVYHTAGDGDLREVIRVIYGSVVADNLLALQHREKNIELSGFISKSFALFKTAGYMTTFLNQRYIQSKNIQEAIIKGYGERILKSHFPFSVIHISMPFNEADINVHPHKLQAVFLNEQNILDGVQKAVREALSNSMTPTVVLAPKQPNTQEHSFAKPIIEQKELEFPVLPKQYKNETMHVASRNADYVLPHSAFIKSDEFEEIMDHIIEGTKPLQQEQKEMDDVRSMVDYKVIGQAFEAFLIVQCADAIYMIDQHAAHERINYERMKQQSQNGVIPSQQMLVPYIEKFAHEDFLLLQQNEELLEELGFQFEEFGMLTYRFDAMPIQAVKSGERALLDEVLYELRQSKGDILLRRDGIIRAACRYSIKAGDELSDTEIRSLMQEITTMDAIPHCPHGRPIAIALTRDELEKGFKRKL